MSSRPSLRTALTVASPLALLLASPSAVLASGTTAGPVSGGERTPYASLGVQQCDASSGARVSDGSKVKEPKLYPDNEAWKYGVIKDAPRMADGSVTIPTVVHVTSDHVLSQAERDRYTRMVTDQVAVLNDSYSGRTGGADSPFRFSLTKINWVVNAAWHTVTPGSTERAMKKALHEGDSQTLNVYTGDIGDGLLGWAYFPKGYNNGRDYIDGVVILDESMPGGTMTRYNQGDTLTHEVGHWMMLEHTFAGACSANGDGVADTPREAVPQFGCPEGADSCPHPGLDPIHNFMDYSEDACMNEFTPGQVERMNDAWVAFRQGGRG